MRSLLPSLVLTLALSGCSPVWLISSDRPGIDAQIEGVRGNRVSGQMKFLAQADGSVVIQIDVRGLAPFQEIGIRREMTDIGEPLPAGALPLPTLEAPSLVGDKLGFRISADKSGVIQRESVLRGEFGLGFTTGWAVVRPCNGGSSCDSAALAVGRILMHGRKAGGWRT